MRFIFTFVLARVSACSIASIPDKTRILLDRDVCTQALDVSLWSVGLFHTAKLSTVDPTDPVGSKREQGSRNGLTIVPFGSALRRELRCEV